MQIAVTDNDMQMAVTSNGMQMAVSDNDSQMAVTDHYMQTAVTDNDTQTAVADNDMQMAMIVTKWMWLLWPPVILALGTLGNVSSLAVLSRMGFVTSSPINVYLLALALSDLLVLYAGLLRYWLLELLSHDIYSWHASACKIGMWLFGAACNNSTYLLVVLTMHRTLSVIWPHRVHLLCTRRTTLSLIGGTAAASFFVMAHVPYGYDVVYVGNSTYGSCGHGSHAYSTFSATVWVYVEIITFALLPFVCLIICNAILAWRLLVSVSAAKLNLSNAGASDQVNQRRKKASSTTITVMAMSATFIIFSLPLFLHLILHSTHNMDAKDQLEAQYSGVDYFLQSFVMIMLFCNFAVNFYLYCLTGTKFRQQFLGLFCQTSETMGVVFVQSSVSEDRHDEF